MKTLGIAILSAIVAVVATAQAETIARWELDDVMANSSSASVDAVHAEMSSSDLVAGAGLDTAIGWPYVIGGFADYRLTPNLENAILGDDYFSFTLTPGADKMVSYSNVFARFAVSSGSNPTSDVTFLLLSDRTGFTQNDALASFHAIATSGFASTIFSNDFDLSSVAELQDVQGATEFRVYVTAVNGNRMAIGHDNFLNTTDDVRVEGTVEDAIVVLAEWDLDGLASNSTAAAASLVHDAMSSSDLAAGMPSTLAAGIGWEDAIGTFAENFRLSKFLTYALSTNNYFGFTLAPDEGHTVSYQSLFARFAVNTGSSPTSDVSFLLLSDRTGFTNTAVLGSFRATSAAPGYESTVFTSEFDLAAVAELQNLTEPTEFRIYVTSAAGDRMAIGHNNFLNTNADLRVKGIIEDNVALARWDLDDTAANSTNAPVDVVHANMSATDLNAQGLEPNTAIGWPDALGSFADYRLGPSLAYSIQEGDYVTFTLTPDAGKQVSYDRVFARLAVNAGAFGADVTFHLLSDTTGFTTNDVLGSVNIVDTDTGNYVPNIVAHEFALGHIAELQNLTNATEFRVYFASENDSNRMAIGHTWSGVTEPDDLIVIGSIEDVSSGVVPATILALSKVSPTVIELVVDAPGAPDLYYPYGRADLTTGGWTGIAHSDNAGGPFVVTNLVFSASSGSNEVIYVETPDSAKFIAIGD